eukprot:TRINITY_DN8709_c0_g1_i1.p1 TRINITY_DN8709_c0_g1~~TRINITY_DN8709_c0_g1_i1.p1  ORF type:complete len:315 (-),score=102.10 TRINITY_DN8709_c0_g1_i1:96-1040(-)
MSNEIYDVTIIGAGVAGLTAGIYTSRASLKTVIFSGPLEDKGGLLVKTSVVENYPGFSNGILGYDLIMEMETQAKKYGAIVIEKFIQTIAEQNDNTFILSDLEGNKYHTKTIIIATGSTPNKLGIENENTFWGKGISSCATCDGALYRKKKIIVVGGGDSAMEEANFLTRFSEVTLIHRRSEFRASKIMQNKVLTNPKIKIIYDTVVEKVNGGEEVTDVNCKNIVTNETFNLPVDGLFYGLGLTPNSKLFQGLIKIDEEGYILHNQITGYETSTSKKGIFVAGDVADKVFRQAVVASGDGCKAAMEVEKYLSHL